MTLSELSYYIRKLGPFMIAGFFGFIILYVIVSSLFSLPSQTASTTKAPYSPPLGMLDPIEFTYSIDYPASFTFSIDNIEGRPITTDTEATVYTVAPTRTKFGYQQTLALMAKNLGFDTEAQKYTLNNLEATYKDELRTLIVDITSFNFEYELNYTRFPEVYSRFLKPDLPDQAPPEPQVIKEEAKDFLRRMNKLPTWLTQGTQNIIYLSYDQSQDSFNVVENPEEADVVEVDFFPPNLDDHPVVSPKFFNSHIFVSMVFTEQGPIVIKSHVNIFEPRSTNSIATKTAEAVPSAGTYPLKTGDDAWQELITGKGTIVSPSKGSTSIVVREMFVGYYALERYQRYLMPVYVFLGDNGFAAYVSAVKNEYVGKLTRSQSVTPQPTIQPSPIIPSPTVAPVSDIPSETPISDTPISEAPQQ